MVVNRVGVKLFEHGIDACFGQLTIFGFIDKIELEVLIDLVHDLKTFERFKRVSLRYTERD
jgi:hypothetical protein